MLVYLFMIFYILFVLMMDDFEFQGQGNNSFNRSHKCLKTGGFSTKPRGRGQLNKVILHLCLRKGMLF